MIKVKNYINGNHTATSNEFIPIFDPSKGEKIGSVVMSDKSDFQNTIQSSLIAQKKWGNVTPLKRSRMKTQKIPSTKKIFASSKAMAFERDLIGEWELADFIKESVTG